MDKRLSRLWGVCLLVGCIGVGMLIQAKVQCFTLEKAAQEVSLVRELTQACSDCAAALNRTTAKRDRLLEHLAALESDNAPTACVPVMVWYCPVREVQP